MIRKRIRFIDDIVCLLSTLLLLNAQRLPKTADVDTMCGNKMKHPRRLEMLKNRPNYWCVHNTDTITQ